MKEKKIINHKFLNRYTVIGAILLMAWGFFFAELIFPMPFGIVLAFITSQEVLTTITQFIAVMLALAIHKRWFFPEYKGCLGGSGFTTALRISWPVLPFWIFTIIRVIAAKLPLQPLTASLLGTALMAGPRFAVLAFLI